MNISGVEKRTLLQTDVYIAKDLSVDFLPRLRTVFEEGALFVLYEKDCFALADTLMHELKKGGYRVFASACEGMSECRDIANLPEFVRYVLCVGKDLSISLAKQVASTFQIGWSLYVTAPLSDDVLCCNAPKQVFISENELVKCQNEQIAAGYGILLSSRLRAFENVFASKVLGLDCVDIEPVECKQINLCELEWQLLKLSSIKVGTDSAECMANVMRALAIRKGKKPRYGGEYRFLASCLLCSLYAHFLGAPSIDCVLPPCESDDEDLLKSLDIIIENKGKCIDFFDVSSYFRISYILSEYRLDLLDKLASADMHGVERFWRRLYPDAGYWLKGEISASEVLYCARLAGVLSNGLLAFAYAGGTMNNF